MNYEQIRAIDEGKRGPFGKWLFEYLKNSCAEMRTQGSLMIPSSIAEVVEREHLLAKSNLLAELIDQIPSKISEELKKAEKDIT